MKFFFKYLLGLTGVFAIALSSCSDAKEPEEDLSCLRPDYTAPMDVYLNINKKMALFKEIDSTRYELILKNRETQTKGVADSCRLRYYVAAIRRNSPEKPFIASSMQNPVRLNIPPDKYTIVGWADYVTEDNGKSYYYYTDEPSEIFLRHKYDYPVDDPFKVGFHGFKKNQPVAYTSTSTTVDCSPAMGMFKLVANDSATYVPQKVVVTYTGSIPASIDGRNGKINGGWSDITFRTEVKKSVNPGFRESVVASDFILGQESEIIIPAKIEIYDDTNQLRARIKNLKIPIVRGGVTIITANFFSIFDFDKENVGGGISIETEYDETVEIVV